MAKIFISFALEDHPSRDTLIAQAKAAKSPFEFVFMPNKQPWIPMWKGKCRTVIRGCHGLVALLSTRSKNAEGVPWELECAREAAIPMLGVYINKADKSTPPAELSESRVIEWTWDEIAKFLAEIDTN